MHFRRTGLTLHIGPSLSLAAHRGTSHRTRSIKTAMCAHRSTGASDALPQLARKPDSIRSMNARFWAYAR